MNRGTVSMRFRSVTSGFLAMLMALSVPSAVSAAEKKIDLSLDNFADEAFILYLGTNFDTDGDLKLSTSEINAVTDIDCSGLEIKDLKGIGYFKSLKTLNCSNNQLTKISIKKNTLLTKLDCSNNQIGKIDISNCPGLVRAKDRGTCTVSEEDGYAEYYLKDKVVSDLKIPNVASVVTDNCTLQGWIDIGVKYYYVHGRPIKSWKLVSNKWYYFDKKTCQMLTGKQHIGSYYYLFTKDGVMRKKGWRQYKGDWYYLNASGCALTGWKKIDKKWYHFSKKGIMACNGKKKIGSKTYKFDKNGVCKNYKK